MGGDYGPSVVVPAALIALEKNRSLQLILVGDEQAIRQELKAADAEQHPRIAIKHTTQIVTMDESPALALRNKKDSSLRVAVNLVHQKEAHACVSSGNTGALMATSKFVLKTLPGVDRPAIISALPTMDRKNTVRMLDLGANVDSSPEHLVQFAVMGSVVASAISGISNPKVGLLNIGTEAIKGNEQVKKAAKLLEEQTIINFVGNIEGDQIFSGDVDIIVCDGFAGNISLKTSEGAVALIFHYLRQSFERNLFTKMFGLIAKYVLRDMKAQLDPDNYNGACLVGLKGIVVKSHGSAKTQAFANAINEAILLVAQKVTEQIETHVASALQQQDAQ